MSAHLLHIKQVPIQHIALYNIGSMVGVDYIRTKRKTFASRIQIYDKLPANCDISTQCHQMKI